MHGNKEKNFEEKWFRIEEKRGKKLISEIKVDGERSRFDAKIKGQAPRLYISYGFSELDPFTNSKYVWDLWVKFPFSVSKAKCELFKEKMQDAFQEVFLS